MKTDFHEKLIDSHIENVRYYSAPESDADDEKTMSLKDVFKTCLYLGITSFGGPIAHIGLFNQVFVKDKKIISERGFSELFALCNVIPGPTSSQLLTAIATVKTKSLLGGIISFLCFNMPALFVMILLGSIMRNYNESYQNLEDNYFMIKAIKLGIWQCAVALVLQAAINLSKRITKSYTQLMILILSAVFYLIFNNFFIMIVLMLTGGLMSVMMQEEQFLSNKADEVIVSKKIAFLGLPSFLSFLLIYALLSFASSYGGSLNLYLMESFYRIGSLIVGGGHVVIPLILTEFSNMISETNVLNAFSIVSILPGPMFNIAGYIGTFLNGISGGFLSAISLFLPGILLLFSVLHFINYINNRPNLQFALRGISSAAIGFIFTSCIILWYDSCFKLNPYSHFLSCLNVVLCYILLERYKLNVVIVMLCAAIYSILTALLFQI